MPPTVLSWAPMVAMKTVAAPFYTRYSAGRSPNNPAQPQHLGGGDAPRSQSGARRWADGGRVFQCPRPLPLLSLGVRSEWLAALHGRGSARQATVAPLCGFGRCSLWLLGLFCPGEENKMSPP